MFGNLRVDSMKNVNVNMTKTFTIYQNPKVQFRAEAFNLSNRPLFDTPNLTPASSTFGFITDPTDSPRAIRIALRTTF
jgi:hypothetical protein